MFTIKQWVLNWDPWRVLGGGVDFIILLELYPEFCMVVQFSGVGVCDPPERHN